MTPFDTSTKIDGHEDNAMAHATRRIIAVLIKAFFHIGSLVALFITINIVPSYLIYAALAPQGANTASNYAGGVLLFTTFITTLVFADIVIRTIKRYVNQVRHILAH